MSTHANFNLVRRAPDSPSGLGAWLAIPRWVDPRARPLVAVHGIRRGARSQALRFAPEAAKQGRVVIAPRFVRKRFGGYQRVIMPTRSDLALLELLDGIAATGLCDTRRFDLFGYSGGAQFVHRFAMFYPHRIGRLSVLAAGWYTFPDSEPYPYGLAPPRRSEIPWCAAMANGLGQFLELPIQVCVGALDDVPDVNTRSTKRVNRQQGTNRLMRARRWAEALVESAEARKIPPRIELNVLPGCGHDFGECMTRGRMGVVVLGSEESPSALQLSGPASFQNPVSCDSRRSHRGMTGFEPHRALAIPPSLN